MNLCGYSINSATKVVSFDDLSNLNPNRALEKFPIDLPCDVSLTQNVVAWRT